MTYTPTVWHDGDVVTSEKLNKLEQGAASGVVVLHASLDDSNGTVVLDMPFGEIKEHAENGDAFIMIINNPSNENEWRWGFVTAVEYASTGSDPSYVWVMTQNTQVGFAANSLDEYPAVLPDQQEEG